MRRRINKSLLMSFIMPYIVVVLIVFAAQYISNTVVMNALKTNIINIVENSFTSNVGVIEQNLTKIKETAALVAQNTAERLEKVRRESKTFYTDLSEIHNELESYNADTGVIKDICVQNDVNNYLVNFDTAYRDRMHYYQTTVYSDKLNAEELLRASETANGFSTENACYYSGNLKTIPFVFPTPILKNRTGSVLVYANEKELLLPMRELLNKSKGALLILDSKGKTVSFDGFEPDEDDNGEKALKKITKAENGFVFKATGASSKWSYTISLPESYVLSSLHYYQLVSLAFNFIMLILGFAVCLMFNVKKTKSYLELIETLGVQPENIGVWSLVPRDEYTGLRQHISRIKNENSILLEKEYQDILRKILYGHFEKNDDILKELKNHSLEFQGSEYGVIVINYSDENYNSRRVKNFDVVLVEKLRNIISDAKICFVRNSVVAVIFAFNGCDYREVVNNYIADINKQVFSKYKIGAFIAAGDQTTELCQLAKSYKQAEETVDYNYLMDASDFYLYSDLPTDDDYYFPIETENALFKSVLESDFNSARTVLRDIQRENFVNRSLCVNAINELIAELRASIKKICRMQSEYLEFSQADCSVNHFFENAISFVYAICSESDSEKETQSRGQKLCSEIRNYIDLHYSNPRLSLDVIAEEFRIHPNYLSTLFKKHTGSNLISYLEGVRIEKAADLLAGGKYTVNEVSVSVGFANDSTFRRRFKKIKGVPPSNYLKY